MICSIYEKRSCLQGSNAEAILKRVELKLMVNGKKKAVNKSLYACAHRLSSRFKIVLSKLLPPFVSSYDQKLLSEMKVR